MKLAVNKANGSVVWWDDQRTMRFPDGGVMFLGVMFLDDNGNDVREADIVFICDGNCTETPCLELHECELCDVGSAVNPDVTNYYALSEVPQDPLWLCDKHYSAKAERAEESRNRDFYGGDSPTEQQTMEAARRLK
jgi:hypothetical protein